MMIITTTPAVEGRPVQRYLAIVSGEAVLSANIMKDLFAGVQDIVGGRSKAYEKELGKAREIAMQEMKEMAGSLGANAIVGVDLTTRRSDLRAACSWFLFREPPYKSRRPARPAADVMGNPIPARAATTVSRIT